MKREVSLFLEIFDSFGLFWAKIILLFQVGEGEKICLILVLNWDPFILWARISSRFQINGIVSINWKSSFFSTNLWSLTNAMVCFICNILKFHFMPSILATSKQNACCLSPLSIPKYWTTDCYTIISFLPMHCKDRDFSQKIVRENTRKPYFMKKALVILECSQPWTWLKLSGKQNCPLAPFNDWWVITLLGKSLFLIDLLPLIGCNSGSQ